MGRTLDTLEATMYGACSKGSLYLANVLLVETQNIFYGYHSDSPQKDIGVRHPLFRMREGEGEGKFVFREMKNYEIDFSESDSCDWVDEFERPLKMPYDAQNGPLWRAVVVPQDPHKLAIVSRFNHAIVDGPSYCKILSTSSSMT